MSTCLKLLVLSCYSLSNYILRISLNYLTNVKEQIKIQVYQVQQIKIQAFIESLNKIFDLINFVTIKRISAKHYF